MVTREQVIAKLTDYVGRLYGGDWDKAFAAEDRNGDGRLSRAEVVGVLQKASIGGVITRGAIAQKIAEELDSDNDGLISLDEFRSVAGEKK
jgi:Ca2+-binding EF-hand superfamily protein